MTLLLTALVRVVPTSAAEEGELPAETAVSQEEENEPGETEETDEPPEGEESGAPEYDDEEYYTDGYRSFPQKLRDARELARICFAVTKSVPAVMPEGPNLMAYIIPFYLMAPVLFTHCFLS